MQGLVVEQLKTTTASDNHCNRIRKNMRKIR